MTPHEPAHYRGARPFTRAAAPDYAGTAAPAVKGVIDGRACHCFRTDTGAYVCTDCEEQGRTEPSPTAYDHRSRKGHCACPAGGCSCVDWPRVERATADLARSRLLDGDTTAQLHRLTAGVIVQRLRAAEEAEEGARQMLAAADAMAVSPDPGTARQGRLYRHHLAGAVARGRRLLLEQARLKLKGDPGRGQVRHPNSGTAAQGVLGQLDVDAAARNARAEALADDGRKKPRRRTDADTRDRNGTLAEHLAAQQEQERDDALRAAVDGLDPGAALACLVQALYQIILLQRAASAA